VQIHAAVESMVAGVEAHGRSPGLGGGLIPHRGWELQAP
jgi:hypothetical protein